MELKQVGQIGLQVRQTEVAFTHPNRTGSRQCCHDSQLGHGPPHMAPQQVVPDESGLGVECVLQNHIRRQQVELVLQAALLGGHLTGPLDQHIVQHLLQQWTWQ